MRRCPRPLHLGAKHALCLCYAKIRSKQTCGNASAMAKRTPCHHCQETSEHRPLRWHWSQHHWSACAIHSLPTLVDNCNAVNRPMRIALTISSGTLARANSDPSSKTSQNPSGRSRWAKVRSQTKCAHLKLLMNKSSGA